MIGMVRTQFPVHSLAGYPIGGPALICANLDTNEAANGNFGKEGGMHNAGKSASDDLGFEQVWASGNLKTRKILICSNPWTNIGFYSMSLGLLKIDL